MAMGAMGDVGRFLVAAGTVVVVIGVLLLLADKVPLGRLPGDLRIGGGRFGVYLPVATCVLLSALITVMFNLLWRR